jgi:hypothetical protein
MLIHHSTDVKIIRGNKRKIFYIQDTSTHAIMEIRAVGVILYKKDKFGKMALIKYNISKFNEDLGGKVELCDKNTIDTAIREVYEETNHQIRLNHNRFTNAKYVYSPTSKYLIYIIRATKRECAMDNNSFGHMENGDFILCKMNYRIIAWEYIANLYDMHINPRINDCLDKIVRSIK